MLILFLIAKEDACSISG